VSHGVVSRNWVDVNVPSADFRSINVCLLLFAFQKYPFVLPETKVNLCRALFALSIVIINKKVVLIPTLFYFVFFLEKW
jgi:hypothetical protein